MSATRIECPVYYRGGHAAAVRTIGRISQLVESRGVKIALTCPRRQRALSAPICTVVVKGATPARTRWAFSRVLWPLLMAERDA